MLALSTVVLAIPYQPTIKKMPSDLLIGTFSIKVPSSQVTLVHVKQIKLSSSLGGADIFAVDGDSSKCVGLTADSCDSNCGFSIPGL